MSGLAHGGTGERALVWALVAIGLLIVAVANWRLVDLAERSQPECVAHRRAGVEARGDASYAAAASACTP
ncbi:MAG TPA: hypothetical protein PKA55_08645 [Rhodoblastus sp.]|nr:hypothetical protein [Rhodoblastus sp.]